MVRVNIINPKNLSDQHLIAEYLEIIMLINYIKKHSKQSNIPKNYALGKGHMKFFKNKLKYLKKRYELIKNEMKKRGFKTNISINLAELNRELKNDWKPTGKDKSIIKKRLIQKIKLKPGFYRYYRKKATSKFLLDLIKRA